MIGAPDMALRAVWFYFKYYDKNNESAFIKETLSSEGGVMYLLVYVQEQI